VSFDDIMAKLYFCYQMEKGLKQLDEGKGIDREEIERRIAEWVKE